jgi:hypothetical protein
MQAVQTHPAQVAPARPSASWEVVTLVTWQVSGLQGLRLPGQPKDVHGAKEARRAHLQPWTITLLRGTILLARLSPSTPIRNLGVSLPS